MREKTDVAVIGGGVVGCAIAYSAARRGASVILLESDELGGGSSGALAGMLSGQGEAEPPGPLFDLLVAGREYHRQIGDKLREASGVDPGYVWDGALGTASDDASGKRLVAQYREQAGAGLSVRWLAAEEARELEPELSEEVRAGLHMPDDGHVNPSQLLQAFVSGATGLGARRREATRVTGFLSSGRRVTGVRTTDGEISAGAVVLAAGAYSGLLSGQLGLRLPLFPMKGEILVARLRPSPVKATVWGGGQALSGPQTGRAPDRRSHGGARRPRPPADRRGRGGAGPGGDRALADAGWRPVRARPGGSLRRRRSYQKRRPALRDYRRVHRRPRSGRAVARGHIHVSSRRRQRRTGRGDRAGQGGGDGVSRQRTRSGLE